ncbi:hypothetical protein GCM10010524_61990 [Streptomyces mexicanus]
MVASVAGVRQLVVVMRSVNQTGAPTPAPLSTCWTFMDVTGRRPGPAPGTAVTSGDGTAPDHGTPDRPPGARPDGREVCPTPRPSAGSGAGRRAGVGAVRPLGRNRVAACLMP